MGAMEGGLEARTKGCVPGPPMPGGPLGNPLMEFPTAPNPVGCPLGGDDGMNRPGGDAGPMIISILLSPLILPRGMSMGCARDIGIPPARTSPLASCILGGMFPN